MTKVAAMDFQILSVAAVVVTAVWVLGWWLRSQLQEVKDAGEERWEKLKSALDKKYDDHEDKDQRRHEDNLTQFAKIYIALTQLGWRNGSQIPPRDC